MAALKAWGIKRLFECDWYSGVVEKKVVWGERPAPFRTEQEAEERCEKLKEQTDHDGLVVTRLYADQVR